MKRLILSLASLLVASAALGAAPEPATLQSLLNEVITSDGISKQEAENIARAYFLKNVGCGAFFGIQDGDTIWLVEAAFGYDGRPVEGFTISKASGAVSSPIGPSYEHPNDMLRQAQPITPPDLAHQAVQVR